MAQHWSPTPDEARAQLAQAEQPPMSTVRDRRVHAAALAVSGLALGTYVALLPSFGVPSTGTVVGFVVVMAVLLLVQRWRSSAGTRPLDSTRLEKRAGVTMALAGIVALQVVLATGAGQHWWVQVVLGLVYAAPYCVAAALVLRNRR